MSRSRTEIMVAVAFTHGAEVLAWKVTATREAGERIGHCLNNLLDIGQVAAFSIRAEETVQAEELVEKLRSRLGEATVDACTSSTATPTRPLPSFLMPVWAFDHMTDGFPASTGQLLGLDLALIATPSPDEELGAHLPDRAGRWLIHARPMF